MPNAPKHSYDTRVYYSANGSSYTELTGITSATPPELACTKAPAHALTDLGMITVPGKVDLGEFALDMLFDRSVYATLYNTLFRQDGYYFRIQYPDASPVTNGSKCEFRGYVCQVGPPQADDDSVLRNSVSIKVNTFPSWTSAGA